MCWRDLAWIPRAATGGFRTEVYGPRCGYLSRSPAPVRHGFLNAHRMSQWDRRAKAVAEGKARITDERAIFHPMTRVHRIILRLGYKRRSKAVPFISLLNWTEVGPK